MELVLENLPEACLTSDCIIGIDEAGRGPVLGPLVYTIFVCPVGEEGRLKDLAAGDSKEKSVGERETFYGALQGHCSVLGWKAAVLHPQTISNCMLRKDKYNLNTLSHDTVFDLIQYCRAVKKINITKGFVDTLGPADKYEAKLSARFPGIDFTVCSKADSKFPVVGAASIVAKVTRDQSLHAMMKSSTNGDQAFGCGYPSDPTTVKWLHNNVDPVFGFSEVVRFSWSSCDRILQEKAAKVVWSDIQQESSDISTCTIHTASALFGLS